MYAIKSIPYVVQLHYKNSKNRKKKKQKFTTLDRLVMKIFRERGRTSRRGTRSFSSITTAALQNAQRVPAFSSSLFQLSLLLSFVSSLRTLFFLPVVSVSVHDSTSTLNVAIIPPHSLFFPLSPSPFTSQLLYPPSLSLFPPQISVSLTPPLPTLPLRLLSSFYSLSLTRLFLLLHSVPDLFYSRDVIAACIFYETSLEAYAHLYPSIRLCCIRLFANSTPCTSRRTTKILPFALSLSLSLSQCFVSWLTFKVIRYENLQCKISWIYLTINWD